MTIVFIGLAIAAVGFLGIAIGRTMLDGDYDYLGFGLVFTGILVVAIGVAIPTITLGSRAYGRAACRSYAHNTGRVTKFVTYTVLSTGECLTPDGRGRWIPTDNLREFGSQP